MAAVNFLIEQFIPGLPRSGTVGSNITTLDFSGVTTFLLPAGTTIGGSSLTALGTITSSSAQALAVGLNGLTNPAFNVDASTGSQAAGLNVIGATAAGTVAVVVISSGAAANLSINAKGTGTLALQTTATGAVSIATSGGTIGLYATTPVVKYATTGTVTGFTAGASTAVLVDSTFTGNTGATAYTISDIVRALKLIGVMTA